MSLQHLHLKRLQHKQIHSINESLLFLKHFIELNAKLLPMLHHLSRISDPTEEERRQLYKIYNVFGAFGFEENTSVELMHSNILEIIRDNYAAVFQELPKDKITALMADFNHEYLRLKQNWKRVAMN